MAFADYLDLRTAVIEQIGSVDITDVFDRLTKLAEARLNRMLRTKEQIIEIPITASAGQAPLPSNYLEMIALYDARGCEVPQKALQQLDTNAIDAGNYTLQYYAAIPTLTAGLTESNWLLEMYPDVYLYAVAYEAARHTRDVEAAQAMRALRDDAVMDARDSDYRSRYARVRVRVQGVTP